MSPPRPQPPISPTPRLESYARYSATGTTLWDRCDPVRLAEREAGIRARMVARARARVRVRVDDAEGEGMEVLDDPERGGPTSPTTGPLKPLLLASRATVSRAHEPPPTERTPTPTSSRSEPSRRTITRQPSALEIKYSPLSSPREPSRAGRASLSPSLGGEERWSYRSVKSSGSPTSYFGTPPPPSSSHQSATFARPRSPVSAFPREQAVAGRDVLDEEAFRRMERYLGDPYIRGEPSVEPIGKQGERGSFSARGDGARGRVSGGLGGGRRVETLRPVLFLQSGRDESEGKALRGVQDAPTTPISPCARFSTGERTVLHEIPRQDRQRQISARETAVRVDGSDGSTGVPSHDKDTLRLSSSDETQRTFDTASSTTDSRIHTTRPLIRTHHVRSESTASSVSSLPDVGTAIIALGGFPTPPERTAGTAARHSGERDGVGVMTRAFGMDKAADGDPGRRPSTASSATVISEGEIIDSNRPGKGYGLQGIHAEWTSLFASPASCLSFDLLTPSFGPLYDNYDRACVQGDADVRDRKDSPGGEARGGGLYESVGCGFLPLGRLTSASSPTGGPGHHQSTSISSSPVEQSFNKRPSGSSISPEVPPPPISEPRLTKSRALVGRLARPAEDISDWGELEVLGVGPV